MEVKPWDEVFTVRGRITYRDIFGKERHRTFGQGMKWNEGRPEFYSVGQNDEEEWSEG